MRATSLSSAAVQPTGVTEELAVGGPTLISARMNITFRQRDVKTYDLEAGVP